MPKGLVDTRRRLTALESELVAELGRTCKRVTALLPLARAAVVYADPARGWDADDCLRLLDAIAALDPDLRAELAAPAPPGEAAASVTS